MIKKYCNLNKHQGLIEHKMRVLNVFQHLIQEMKCIIY